MEQDEKYTSKMGYYPCTYMTFNCDEAISFFKILYKSIFKDNTYLEKTILTGVSRVAKKSIFSGVNNFDIYTVLNDEFLADSGITSDGIDKIISDFNI